MMKSLFWRLLLGAALFSAGCIQTAARALSSTQASEMADGGPLDKPLFTFTIGGWEVDCGQNAEGRFLTLRKDGSHHMLRINEGSPGETSLEDVIRLATAYMRQEQMFDLEVDENATLPTDRRQQERAILVKLYFAVLANETDRLALTAGGNWLSNESVCNWVGVSCGPLSAKALPGGAALPTVHAGIMEPLPQDAVTAIQLPALGLKGTIPSELGLLEFLYKIRLDHNRIKGTIPESLGRSSSLRYIDLSSNRLDGSIPTLLGTFEHLQYLSLGCNFLTGTILEDTKQWSINLQHLDLSENAFRGTIHPQLASYAKIRYLVLDDNYFTGTIPSLLGSASEKLEHLDMASNLLTGTIPSELSNCQYLQYLVVGENLLTGTLPSSLFQLSRLHALILSDNLLHGKLPTDDWASMTALGVLYLQDNHFTGTLPPGIFQSEQKQMRFLDVSRNHFRGTIPRSIGQLTGLRLIHAAGNRLAGTLPAQLTKLHKNLRLNFTDNLITGRIPSLFCGQGSSSLSLLYHNFGCDAVLCPAGTFNRYGHATLYSGCRACPNIPLGEEKVLGRISCEGMTNVHGDLDGDGVVSQREVLRLLYINTIGRFWGKKYQKWALMDVNECDLEGVVCVRDNVAKIDLQGAELCKASDGYPGSADFCLGVPTEIGLLTGLEIFQLSRQGFLRGNIPTEIGHLTKLRQFDVSSNPSMSGTIPTEVGKLTQLVHFLVSFCTFTGSMPSELFLLTRLERMQLTDNDLTGTFPDEIHLSSLKELMTSRNVLSGTIPTELGVATKLENFEAYGNSISGPLPSELGNCGNLKRVDLFNNKLTGTIPVEVATLRPLQILHFKNNDISGTIPSEFGELPDLSWFDFSGNYLHGTIPASFGESSSIKDFRIADNMLDEPVPESLCANIQLNGGMTTAYGCSGVMCPLGTFSDSGFATESSNGCTPCPKDESTLYAGSTACQTFDDKDILSIIKDVMGAVSWPIEYGKTWNKENDSVDVCDWYGVGCDANGEIVSLKIPVPSEAFP